MTTLLAKIKSRFAPADEPVVNDPDVIAFVNEARTDAERMRIARAATERARRAA